MSKRRATCALRIPRSTSSNYLLAQVFGVSFRCPMITSGSMVMIYCCSARAARASTPPQERQPQHSGDHRG